MKINRLNRVMQALSLIAIVLFIVNCSGDDSSEGSGTPASQIVVTGSVAVFDPTNVSEHSASQSIEVKGSNLNANMTISASENFEVSLNDNTFSGQVSIAKDDANASNTSVYVRFSPATNAIGQNTGTLTLQSDQASTVTIQLSGVGLSTDPMIHVPVNNLSFSDTNVGEVSQSINMTINGDNLTSDIALSVTEGFTVSIDNAAFTDTVQIPAAIANDDTLVYLRFEPSEAVNTTGTLTLSSTDAENVEIALSGTGLAVRYNYLTFDQQHLAFGGGASQSSQQSFMLHDDVTNISTVKMFVRLDCPTAGCNAWDVFAHVQVRDVDSGEWYEMGRYITPYGIDNNQLDRGFEIDVTDFKSLLTGNVELRAYIEVWGSDGWNLTVDFDFIEDAPDYPYYAISRVVQYNQNSLEGVIYGEDASAFDLTKSISVPSNAESTHLRTIITGWGHATPSDPDGRPCAEWCYRTHDVKINNATAFQHSMEGLGCNTNPVSPQAGNWAPDRAGWCPGMAVPVRVNHFATSMAGNTFDFEYDFEDWTNNLQSTADNIHAYYAISTFVVVKSNTPITKPNVVE